MAVNLEMIEYTLSDINFDKHKRVASAKLNLGFAENEEDNASMHKAEFTVTVKTSDNPTMSELEEAFMKRAGFVLKEAAKRFSCRFMTLSFLAGHTNNLPDFDRSGCATCGMGCFN